MNSLFIFKDPEGNMSSPKPYDELVSRVKEAGVPGEILHCFLTPFAESRVHAEIVVKSKEEILKNGEEKREDSPVREAAPAVSGSVKGGGAKGRKAKALPGNGGHSSK